MTTNELVERAWGLVDQAAGLPPGSGARVAAFEEAIRLADTAADIDAGFDIRQEFVRAGFFEGANDRALVAFTWCLGQADRYPDRFNEDELLWQYKWIAGSLPSFVSVPRQRIESVIDDLDARMTKRGYNRRPVYKIRARVAAQMGDAALEDEYERRWQRTPRDLQSDCVACDLTHHADYLATRGRDREAVVHAGPVVRERYTCKHEPHRILAGLLLPLFRLGRLKDAADFHARGYPLVCRNRDFVYAVQEHIEFLVVTDNLSRAVKLFERHLPWALKCAEESERFYFDRAAWLLGLRLDAAGKSHVPCRVAAGGPPSEEPRRLRVATLIDWAEGRIRPLAEQFDRRNGTSKFAGELARTKELLEAVRAYPLRSADRQPRPRSGGRRGPEPRGSAGPSDR